jgi:acetyl esterase/lipase
MAKRLNWVALIKRGYTLFPVVNRDADKLVPIQQAHRIMPKFKAAGVEARLLVMPGKDHGWVAEPAEVKMVGEWFDKHLLESR